MAEIPTRITALAFKPVSESVSCLLATFAVRPYARSDLDIDTDADLAAHAGIGIQKIVAGSAFSLGLMLIVNAGAELFTGNNLMVSRDMSREIHFKTMYQRWALVFVANFAG